MQVQPMLPFGPDVPRTTEEAGREWGVSKETASRWIRNGHVQPLRKLPGRGGYLISFEEIERVKSLFAQGLRFGEPRGRWSS